MCGDIAAVGADRNDLVVVCIDLQSAKGFTDTTKGIMNRHGEICVENQTEKKIVANIAVSNSRYIMRQRKIERRTLVNLAFGPYFAAMPLHNALHDGQSNACSFKFLITVKPLEYIK